MEACKAQRKEGVFINVDPFINRKNVLKITGDEFLEKCESKSLDLILCKFSFHFSKDMKVFFRQAHRCLKDSGRMAIFHTGAETKLPWS